MRILVTGGAGFIGSHLTDVLLVNGDQVAVLDDMSRGRPERLHPSVGLHHGDITDVEELREAVDRVRPDLICHLAAQIDVRVSVASAAQDALVNVVGTVNVLEAARRADARVVVSSTGGAIYGEEAPVPCSEGDQAHPMSPYGTAKYCAEQYVGLYNRLHGTTHTALRLSNVYGPRQSPGGGAGVVGLFCEAAVNGERPAVFGDGRQTRDLVHVRDAAAAFLAAAKTDLHGIWNIGTGVETNLLTLIDLIGAAAGRPLNPEFKAERPGEVRRSALAVEAARRDLGWKAEIGLADGVDEVYRWIKAGAPDRQAG